MLDIDDGTKYNKLKGCKTLRLGTNFNVRGYSRTLNFVDLIFLTHSRPYVLGAIVEQDQPVLTCSPEGKYL